LNSAALIAFSEKRGKNEFQNDFKSQDTPNLMEKI
jgi:hypothetical protein